MTKRVLAIVLLLTILASGCVTVRIETKINEDGSGTKSFVLALDKSVMGMMESMAEESGTSADDFWEEARAGAGAIRGATVEDYSDDESEGIKITVPFDNLEELVALSSSEAFEGADVVAASKDGDTTTLRATVNVGDVTSGLNEAGGEGFEDFDLGEIELEYTYAVEVEGEIIEYSPKDNATVEGSKVTWDLTQANTNTVELMVKWNPSSGPGTLVILIVAIALIGLLLAIVGVIVMMRVRKSPEQIEAGQA